MPGWGPLDATRALPVELERYIDRIERAVGVPVRIVSVGPDRAHTLTRAVALAS